MRYITIHNTGGLGSDYLAKSSHLTLEQIDVAHRARWSDFKSQMGYFVGYNALIFPDGTMVQTRLIGEETAHTKGFNLTSIGICLLGNFTKGSETPTPQQKMKLKSVLEALLDKDPQRVGLKTLPNIVLDITRDRIVPHRTLQPNTECYGNSLSDTWARDLLSDTLYPDKDKEEKIRLLITLLDLYKSMLKLLQIRTFGKRLECCADADVRG